MVDTPIGAIVREFRELVTERGGVADGIAPPLVFVAVNAFTDVRTAAIAASVTAGAIVLLRLVQRKPLKYAFSGVFGTGIAVALALRSGSAQDYFLPGILTGIATAVLILVSIIARRPFPAWASWVTRNWPLEWYWHPQVRPAYTATAWIWFGFFVVRTSVQGWLYVTEQTTSLGIVRVATGWPGLLGLLIATYLVGRARLEALEGPSVQEFLDGTEPPWEGQKEGF